MSELTRAGAFEAATAAAREGRFDEAEAIMQRALRALKPRFFGGGSAADYAGALFDLASIRLGGGDNLGAVEALRRATEVPLKGEQGEKDHLTYLMNLGETLTRVGDLDGAERVIRDGLAKRERFYGTEHPGYAYGLEPLAELLALRGDSEGARATIDQALDIFSRAGNPQYVSSLALFAYLNAYFQGEDTVFHDPNADPEGQLHGIPDDLIGRLTDHVVLRTGQFHPDAAIRVISDLRDGIAARKGEQDDALRPVQIALSEAARRAAQANDSSTPREEAWEINRKACAWLVEYFDRGGNPEQATQSELGLAISLAQLGDTDASDRAYRGAADRARTLGRGELVSHVLRNYGLHLAEMSRRPEADAILDEAVTEARKSGDAINTGRALGALGIFRQHDGRLDEARGLLEEAVQLLPISHPDTFYARNHLDAIINGHSCGCGDSPKTLAAILRELVESRLPDGLLEDLRLDDKEGISVHLTRKPTRQEAEDLKRAVDLAKAELRRQSKNAGYL